MFIKKIRLGKMRDITNQIDSNISGDSGINNRFSRGKFTVVSMTEKGLHIFVLLNRVSR